MRYVLGLDIGIASVGWAVLALDSNDEPYKIEALNSRIFSQAENPKTGESLALPRRSARGSRRRLRRRRHRLDRIIRLMNSIGLASTDDIARIYGSYKKEAGKITIPGFRKGKAPRAFIEKYYGKEVFYDSAINSIYPDALDEAVKEANIEVIDDKIDFDIVEVGEN